jgi:hypothetical protein
VVFNYNIECEDGNSPDVAFIRNTYLPRYQKAVSDISTELDGIKKTRQENSGGGGGGSHEQPNGGSSSITIPKGDVVVSARNMAPTDTTQRDITHELSADDAATVKQNTQSYIADLPDTPSGKEINVNLPDSSDVSKIAARTNAPVSKLSIGLDVIDITKAPALLRKPDLFYDTYNPNNPLIPPPNVPTVEILAMKVYKNGDISSEPVNGPTGSEGGPFSGQNYMQDYYFQFRLPPDVMKAASAGQDVHTGSKDLYIKTESDLQHVELRHYNYVTGNWDKVPTKSVGNCDLQMCVFVAGPTSGRSYYAIVVDNETSSANPLSIPSLPCCSSPAMIMLLLISLAVTRKEAARPD